MPSHSLVPNNLKRIYKLASRRNVETIPALWGGICAGGVMRNSEGITAKNIVNKATNSFVNHICNRRLTIIKLKHRKVFVSITLKKRKASYIRGHYLRVNLFWILLLLLQTYQTISGDGTRRARFSNKSFQHVASQMFFCHFLMSAKKVTFQGLTAFPLHDATKTKRQTK